MKLRQKIFTTFFIVATSTIFNPVVYAGGDFDSSNPPNQGNISIQTPITPINNPNSNSNNNNSNNNKKNKPHNKNEDDEEFQENSDEFDISTDDNNNSENNSNPQHIVPILQNENSNHSDENLNNHDDNLNNSNDDDFTEDEKVSLDTGVIGDINGDRELNAIDLVVLQKYLKSEVFEINEKAADIDGDGNISKFDVYALLNLIKAEKKGTGDVNNDGKVDIYDVQSLTAYLADPSKGINSKNADLNGDGRISKDDLKILKGVISALRQ